MHIQDSIGEMNSATVDVCALRNRCGCAWRLRVPGYIQADTMEYVTARLRSPSRGRTTRDFITFVACLQTNSSSCSVFRESSVRRFAETSVRLSSKLTRYVFQRTESISYASTNEPIGSGPLGHRRWSYRWDRQDVPQAGPREAAFPSSTLPDRFEEK